MQEGTISNFGEFKIIKTTLALSPICIYQDEISATLNIQDDITPLESANLSMLLAYAGTSYKNGNYFYDYLGYIKEKKLTRHFIIKGE